MSHPPRKIFVVEDGKPTRIALTLLIRSFGWSVRAFASGPECLGAFALERPDCIVTDLNLPGMSGIQMIDVLAQQNIRVPTIIVTSVPPGSPLIEQARSAGAAAILLKPFLENELRRAIEQAISSVSGPETW